MDISYLSTGTGREVLLNHLLQRKGLWLSPPASSDKGTVFTINKIDLQKVQQSYRLEISASGELISLNLGKLAISKFSLGNSILPGSLPDWPEKDKLIEQNEFELPILLDSIEMLMNATSAKTN